MSDRISEADLVLPALLCIEKGTPDLSTTQLQQCLRAMLQPTGEDLEVLAGRTDDKFSQKVRNLRSHEALERRGWVTYERRGNNGYWRLTPAGRSVLENHRELLEGVLAGRFSYEVQQATFREAQERPEGEPERRKVLIFDEDETVTEGQPSEVAVKRRQRSSRLRQIAMRHFRRETGALQCEACGFDFAAIYGPRGDGYIEIHHRKPIFMYHDDDMEQSVQEALENLVPLCANCHRMVHRRRDHVWTIQQLRDSLSSP